MDDGVLAQTIEVGDLRMHVHEEGSGEPVLLLHGFPQGALEWKRVGADLARDVRVIVPDLRGAGLTDAPDSRYDLATTRSDILRLLDALDIERATIVAHDWSALPAFSLAIEHPDRVGRLVALSVPPPYLRMSWSMLGSGRYLWFQYALAMPGLGPRLLSGGGQRLPRWLLRAFSLHGIDPGDQDRYLAALREPPRARAGSRLYRQLIVPEFLRIVTGRYRGRPLTMPVLLLFGEQDGVIPQSAMHGFEQDAPQLRIEAIPDAAHFVVDDQPDAVTGRIREFLSLPVR